MSRRVWIAWLAVLFGALSAPSVAGGPSPLPIGPMGPMALVAPVVPQATGGADLVPDAAVTGLDAVLPGTTGIGGAAPVEGGGRFSRALEIALLLTVLSMLPAVLITLTSFTRIVIVLSFVRRALSINELPPNPVIIGLSLFLTMFVMAPVGKRVYEVAWEPYQDGAIPAEVAGAAAWTELRSFLIANTRENELAMFSDMVYAGEGGESSLESRDDLEDAPAMVVVPAFILSELKTAFQMGFLLFLPFLVIDLIVSSVLLSMGMFMLPPVMISTPFKILIFVLVDGWRLICESVVTSFVTA